MGVQPRGQRVVQTQTQTEPPITPFEDVERAGLVRRDKRPGEIEAVGEEGEGGRDVCCEGV